LRIHAIPCVDSMSGERHGSTVEVELDDTLFRGCGDLLAR
jgi:uncharacterized membrane protein